MTMKFKANLSNVKDVKEFVALANRLPNIVKVSHGLFTVNGKSLLGLFSLDLSYDVDVEVIGDVNEAFRYELEAFSA